jgi:beta-glucosidase
MVLLKNERGLLPLSKSVRSVAVIGPLADSRQDMLGTWTADGRPEDVVTVLEGIRQALPPDAKVSYAKGCDLLSGGRDGFDEALRTAQQAELAVLVVGEPGDMSGEGGSRAYLNIPGSQEALVEAVRATGKPMVVVLMSGRPLAIQGMAENAPALIEAWFPGVEAGHAVADVLFGDTNPGGKLPVTFPRTLGQVPLYYNHKSTGRPGIPSIRTTSRYLDETNDPVFPFGHGLSYSTFALDALALSAPTIRPDGKIKLSVDVANTSNRAGDEVVQLYIQDVVSSTTRPVRELAGFRRVTLAPGAKQTVSFEIGTAELGFYDRALRFVVEPGEFKVWVGTSSVGGLEAGFRVEPGAVRPAVSSPRPGTRGPAPAQREATPSR